MDPQNLSSRVSFQIQAAAWTALSLISILFHNSVIELDVALPYYSYRYILYQIFLNPDYSSNEVMLNSNTFQTLMIITAILNAVWLVVSLFILWTMLRDKWENVYFYVGGWSAVTMLIAVFDIILMGLLVADLVTVQDLGNQIVTSTHSPDYTTVSTTLAPPSDLTTATPPLTDFTLPSSISPLPTTLPPDPATTTIATTTESTTEATTTTESTSEASTTTESTTEASTIESTTGGNAVARYFFDPSVMNEGDFNYEASVSFILFYSTLILKYLLFQLYKQLVNGSYFIVITLAARGYVLWIINVVLAVILMKIGMALSRQAASSLLPMIDGYSTGRAPWGNLYEQTDIGNGYSNAAFADDNDKHVFPRSDSFVNADPDPRNHNPLSKGANPYAQQMDKLRPVPVPTTNPNIISPKVAKIGKQSNGRRTPPRNVPPPNIPRHVNTPYIPDPDYTPPASPTKPKSVLRPRSNYVL
ncbi:hypothetical protein NQ315_006414 [Exocentrus adspersus]|uniref:Uncharacterized protein n=1 Tax=Exocentrus adspersus TaxID=1586481 RepID=A0AAV8W028_9CUCU|nr:hypothetical protein NQ315_006414 [Exocentrus adspersus]